MAERDSSLYALQTIEPVAALSKLQISESNVELMVFDLFESLEAFTAGDVEPIDRLRLTFIPQPPSTAPRMAESFATAYIKPEDLTPYQQIIDAIKAKALDILGVGGRGYVLTDLYIDTLVKSLKISARSSDGDHTPSSGWSSKKYDKLFADNRELAVSALMFALGFAKSHDPFLGMMVSV